MSEERIMIGLDLAIASKEVLEILCDEAADPSIFNDICTANTARNDVLKMLYDHADAPQDVIDHIAPLLNLPVRKGKPGKAVSALAVVEKEKIDETTRQKKSESLLLKIKNLSIGERVQLAMRGGKEVRGILLKDTSKEVVKKVLENPKMTESEVELLAMNRNITDEALRFISKKREWMKNYSITMALVNNPKTPGGIAVPFMKKLKTKDLSLLEKNKNVSEAVRTTAKRLLAQRRPH